MYGPEAAICHAVYAFRDHGLKLVGPRLRSTYVHTISLRVAKGHNAGMLQARSITPSPSVVIADPGAGSLSQAVIRNGRPRRG
jgi:hypothetical protein